jgi:hypothetical protein
MELLDSYNHLIDKLNLTHNEYLMNLFKLLDRDVRIVLIEGDLGYEKILIPMTLLVSNNVEKWYNITYIFPRNAILEEFFFDVYSLISKLGLEYSIYFKYLIDDDEVAYSKRMLITTLNVFLVLCIVM